MSVEPLPPPKFAVAARAALADPAVRRSLRAETAARREGRAETSDWRRLRETGAALRDRVLLDLDTHLERFEAAATAAGAIVHWARDAAEAAAVVTGLVRATGRPEVAAPGAGPVLAEIGLAGALGALEIAVVPEAPTVVTGADFAVADTGTLVAVAGLRAHLALAETLITVVGLEQLVPAWRDLEVFLQLLPRSSGAGRTAPEVSSWTGVYPGDGPRTVHVVLLDAGRTRALADETGREALRCIRCGACSAVCPVYRRTGDGAYGPGEPGPPGAMLEPQKRGVRGAWEASLPFASTLCGACTEVCPVGIDIPGVLVYLRGKVVEARRHRPVPNPEMALMRGLAWTMGDRSRYDRTLARTVRWARLLARGGRIRRLPGLLGKWTDARDLPAPPRQGFHAWWRRRGVR